MPSISLRLRREGSRRCSNSAAAPPALDLADLLSHCFTASNVLGARSVEAYADEVAHGAFDGARADVEILASQPVVAHPMLMLGEVLQSSVASIKADLGS